jgi:Flp pilus assembly protein TadD
LDPKRSDIYCDLAVLVYSDGRQSEAEQLLKQAIALDSSNATAYYDLGVLYAHAGRAAQATNMYQKALAIDPGYVDAKRGLQAINSERR